ncbi:MAG: glycerate kinase [Proteobacteria bacterium]|nr:glycerate kinase [Pseudomonadota bacterium]
MKSKKTFVLAPDSFKESMTAKEVCLAMESGLKKIFPDANYIHVPMADGGEGTVQSLVDATNGSIRTVIVTGPLGQPVQASYGIMGCGQIGVIEMAAASGIHFVNAETKNPLKTTTYGTGQLIKDCLDQGIKKIILGVGGSATNDGGAGMAMALGVRFYDDCGFEIGLGGGELNKINVIDMSCFDNRLNDVELIVACDVTNPLCGEHGASAVFGPQKGATPEMVETLDRNLSHYANMISNQLSRNVADIPGAGAAGGMGAGLMAFTKCQLKRGVDIVVEYTGLREKLANADLCFTGEGRIDFQTKFGKTPFGVAQVAKENNIPVIAVSGCIGAGVDTLHDEGIDAIFGIIPNASSIDALLKNGPINMERTCENIGRLLKVAMV